MSKARASAAARYEQPQDQDEVETAEQAVPANPLPTALVLRDHFRIMINGVGRVWERGALITDPEAIRIILANDDRGIARKFVEVT